MKSLNDYNPNQNFIPDKNPFSNENAVRFINDHYELKRDDNGGSLTKEGFSILLTAAGEFTEIQFYMHIIFPFWKIFPTALTSIDVMGIKQFRKELLNGNINSFAAKQYLFRKEVKPKLSSKLK